MTNVPSSRPPARPPRPTTQALPPPPSQVHQGKQLFFWAKTIPSRNGIAETWDAPAIVRPMELHSPEFKNPGLAPSRSTWRKDNANQLRQKKKKKAVKPQQHHHTIVHTTHYTLRTTYGLCSFLEIDHVSVDCCPPPPIHGTS